MQVRFFIAAIDYDKFMQGEAVHVTSASISRPLQIIATPDEIETDTGSCMIKRKASIEAR